MAFSYERQDMLSCNVSLSTVSCLVKSSAQRLEKSNDVDDSNDSMYGLQAYL